MKRFAILSVLALCLGMIAPAASAQADDNKNHGNFGVYFDYFRLQFAKQNFFGVGGRLGLNIHPHVVLEGEMSYDFERNATASITDLTGNTTTVRSNLRLIHGLFGPKFQTTGPVRVFFVLKGGLLNFGVSNTAVTVGNVANQFGNIKDGDTNGVFYPGGGVEFNAGHIGLRLEAGDEMYFDNGAQHNFKFMGGPQIRF
jgi:outer membrane protein with beta-barrel domain